MNHVLSKSTSIRYILRMRTEQPVAAVVHSLPDPVEFQDEDQSFFPDYDIKDLKDDELDEISQSLFHDGNDEESTEHLTDNDIGGEEFPVESKNFSEHSKEESELFLNNNQKDRTNEFLKNIDESGLPPKDHSEILSKDHSEQHKDYSLESSLPSPSVCLNKKSPIERLPKDLQNIIFNHILLEDINSVLLTCKTFSEHSTTQLVRAIKQHNVFFRRRLLRFTYLLKLFARPEILVNELNVLQEVSADLADMFQTLHETPEAYAQHKSVVERELRALLEYRKLFGVFVHVVDRLLISIE